MFFFFKQKTAYEMRISDWSSDVCSSDLQDAFVEAVELGPVLLRLQALAVRRWRALGADPRLDRSVLGVEVGHVRDQVLDHFHVRQRIDRHRALALDRRPLWTRVTRALRLAGLLDRADAGQRVGAVDVHRPRTAAALAAGQTEQRRVGKEWVSTSKDQ